MIRILRVSIALLSIAAAAGLRAADPDFGAAHGELVAHLKDLIHLDTSNPPGNESRVANYLRELLAREGIGAEVFEKEAGRGNLVARLKGSGRKRPLLLMAHADVVGVEREKWTVDPFAAVEKDGFIYGRGATDDKSIVATFTQIFMQLKRRQVALDRDVILLIDAGEEATPQVGIEFMIAHHWDKIDCEFALNEGGGIEATREGKLRYFGVTTTEKVPRTMFLSVKGVSGHGSVPRPDNAIVHLAAAVAKLGAWQPPLRLNATTRLLFERLATISPPEQAWIYTHLEDPKIGPQVQELLRVTEYGYNSKVRTSISPTILKGGFRTNVIPGDALATLDIRMLPDENVPAFIEQMRRVIDDPAVEIVPSASSTRPFGHSSSVESEMFLALERAQKRVLPELITLPEMLTGATDMAQLRAKGVQAYGIGEIHIPGATEAHGNDERTSIAGLRYLLEITWHAVVEVAAASAGQSN